MKKLTTLALAGAMAVSSLASASMSRWNGFGAANQFIGDVGDIWTLPAVVASNPDATYMEFGKGYDAVNEEFNTVPGTRLNTSVNGNNYGQAWGGSHMTLGPGVLGIWGNRSLNGLDATIKNNGYTIPNSAAPTGTNPAASNLYTLDHSIDLLYGMNVGENLILGLGVTRAQGTNNISDSTVGANPKTTRDEENTAYGLNLGADIKGLGPIDLLEVGLQYTAGGNINDRNNGTIENKRTIEYNEIDLRVGADIKGDKGKFQRLELTFGNEGLDAKSVFAGAVPTTTYLESKNSGMKYLLGWAKGMSSAKGMGLGGFTLVGSNANSDEANRAGAAVNTHGTNNMSLNFVTAGEAKVKEWLTTRAGFSTSLWNTTAVKSEAGAAGATTITNSSWENGWNFSAPTSTISTGLSLNIGDIVIDGVLNQDLLFNGPFLSNGIATQLYSQVSATWKWGQQAAD